MNAKIFLDSNVLIYAYDNGDRSKQIRAQEILNRGLASNNIVLSVQVLSEFYTTVTKRYEEPLSKDQARDVIHPARNRSWDSRIISIISGAKT